MCVCVCVFVRAHAHVHGCVYLCMCAMHVCVQMCTRACNNNNNNNNDFISKALFHVKHAQLRCTMPMNNTHTCARTHARASKTSDERTIAYKSRKHNTIC